jgi:Protein of unknown function (DUF2950)
MIGRRICACRAGAVVLVCVTQAWSSLSAATNDVRQPTFATPEEAVAALTSAAKAGGLDDLVAIFGPGGRDLVDVSDPATGRRNREVFVVAVAEGWRLVDQGPTRKVLVVGHEGWPFPVPLVRDGNSWRFDGAAGREEILARRIGRNEVAAIRICRTYAAAQKEYAARGHDGKPAGLYARKFRSDPGRQDGLYWPVARGQSRSPLGELVAQAAQEGRPLHDDRKGPSPFYGYYFKILTGQGPHAAGGATTYVTNGDMSAGFALVAWPAQYDATGVMTFVVNQDGIVYESDLGSATGSRAQGMTVYDPGVSWRPVP